MLGKPRKTSFPEKILPSKTVKVSIINKPRRPAWLKGFSVIDMGLYRRSYRQKRTSFADAGLRGIGLSSISV